MEALKLKPLPFHKLFDKLEENVRVVEITKPTPLITAPGLILFGIILTLGVIFAYQIGKGNSTPVEEENTDKIDSEKKEEIAEKNSEKKS